ncbi:MAG: pilus assembly protein [Firmicutes bacterium]|nr:pilus assembly protein [Bacillota bacterium]
MNKKGQALVEFVIVLPILIMVLFATIDFGLIIYNKSKLESKLNDVVNMIKNNESEEKIVEFINKDSDRKTTFRIIDNNDYTTIKLFTSVEIITPGLNIVLDNPYKISVSRVIYDK